MQAAETKSFASEEFHYSVALPAGCRYEEGPGTLDAVCSPDLDAAKSTTANSAAALVLEVSVESVRNDTGKQVADLAQGYGEAEFKAELPEVKKEDIQVSVADGTITISGERKQENKQKGENEIRIESFYGTFSRTFTLPDNVDTKAIRAESKDGVLRVRVPKIESSKSKPIQVEVK